MSGPIDTVGVRSGFIGVSLIKNAVILLKKKNVIQIQMINVNGARTRRGRVNNVLI